ncbi:site-2 protease family protein [Candidatus Zixiibacteriota bacterium]
MSDRLLELILLAPAILFALVIHEYAHGLVADRLGDPTPRSAGRLTLNPIKHLDPIGTVMLFLVRIGWARPVPVNPGYFQNPRLGMVWVSMAGPAANMLGALGCGLLLRLAGAIGDQPNSRILMAFVYMLAWGMVINLVLAAFNLIPLPPLDGSKILAGILPGQSAQAYRRLERFGPLLLLALIILGRSLLWGYIRPFVRFFSLFFGGQGAVHFLSTL